MNDFLHDLVSSLLAGSAIAAGLAYVLKGIIDARLRVMTERSISLFKGAVDSYGSAGKLTFQKTIEFKERQLGEFYWPIYLALEKDNAIWERIFLQSKSDRYPEDIRKTLEKEYIIPNHEGVVAIIEAKMYLAEANSDLLSAINAYVRHVAIYRAMRGLKEYDGRDPIDLGERWPDNLFPLIKQNLERLQREYVDLRKKYNLDVLEGGHL